MRVILLLACVFVAATAVDDPIRVLFVGGDWKSQLPSFQGTTPLRGHFVRQVVDQAAPGRFALTLWTSYEFLQYGDRETLAAYDVIVVGDVMGQSVMPRLVAGVEAFVAAGGGFWYCDNHKAFSFQERQRSFHAVLPIGLIEFRAAEPEASQPLSGENPLQVRVVATDHPIMRGLDWASAPPLKDARHGVPMPGTTVLARSPKGADIWVVRDLERGRSLWTGGLFANDEMSEDFCRWADIGALYAQAFTWLAERSPRAHRAGVPAIAEGTLTIDTAASGPVVTAKHFGIHGQELAPNGGAAPMVGKDLELYQALNLDGTFARTGAFAGIKGGNQDPVDDGTDLTSFDAQKYDWTGTRDVLDDMGRIHAEPLFLYWCPWWGPKWPEPARYTKYFAASLNAVNREQASPTRPKLRYFEIMNEPNLYPHPENVDRYAAFFNHAVEALAPTNPDVRFGCGGFNEWPYVQAVIDRVGPNLHWLSRHPYGHTGEAVFYLHDVYRAHAKAKGFDLPAIITEWDFWIYGEPAFDYIMQRWKPLLDHADSCLGSMHYRWREYHEGGYVFGVHGEFDQAYGELPPGWPNPGRDKPITYRYNAFWIMRHLRGPQATCALSVPAFDATLSPRSWAAATVADGALNIVIHHGYARDDGAKRFDAIKLRVRVPLPSSVTGRTLTVSRADARATSEEPGRPVVGDALDLGIEIPAQSSVALTVR